MLGDVPPHPSGGWRARAYEIVFGHTTRAGRAFDVALMAAILLSVIVVMLDSIPSYQARHGGTLTALEWAFTVLFTIEYVLRLLIVKHPRRYALSFFGLVDLAAVVPTYLSLLLPGGEYLLVVRILRVLRVFRVMKFVHLVRESRVLGEALWASRYKIAVFMFTVLNIVVIVGSVMYLVEGPPSGFDSIPRGVYWAVVTLTTVGFGDITPVTPLGQSLAAFVMILGYAIIAVPTGIVTAEITYATRVRSRTSPPRACPECAHEPAEADARFCSRCGADLAAPPPAELA
ncbi:MAG: ion transporter [Gemmatimonadetes bacterium]|nr:MAG: ion transporter [Gemmatimonadota bacterium]